jgi:dihydroorotate dehydrogenase (NAD+) catalytic subunit
MSVGPGPTRGLFGSTRTLWLASGPLSTEFVDALRFAEVADVIVTKTATYEPRTPSRPPRVARLGNLGLVSREGLPNPGYEVMARTVDRLRRETGATVVASVAPDDDADRLARMARAFEQAGASALESCVAWAQAIALVRRPIDVVVSETVGVLKAVTSLPVIVKLNFGESLLANAAAAVAAGADALCALDAVFPALHIDVTRRRSALGSPEAGLTGPAIRPLAVASVFQLSSRFAVPTLGAGGIEAGIHVLEFIQAGAYAVQLCTAPMREGPGVFKRIRAEIHELCPDGADALERLRGAAHQ